MRYVFEEFSLDTDRFELCRDGRPIKLQPRAFEILVHLIAERHRLVLKDELFDRFWAQRVVGDAALNTVIKAIRRALNDSGRSQRFIRTSHKRGYRFVAEVTERPGESIRQQPEDTEEAVKSSATVTNPPAELVREYKHVTVLCCRLTDADRLAQRLGAEPMDRLVRAFFGLAEATLRYYGGTALQWLEDGFVAVFGAPQAYEDHTRRAVLAASELARPLSANRSPELVAATSSSAMGLHSGPVVVGNLTMETGRPFVAASDTVQLTRELQQRAGPGVILISAAARQLVQAEVETEPVMAIDIKAYRIIRMMARHAGVPQRGVDHLTAFVGRDRELAILHERLDHVAEGRGQIVSLVGEPGIGKSRLLRQFHHGCDHIRYYQGQCWPYTAATPFAPVLELIRQICRIDPNDDPSSAVRKVMAATQRAGLGVPEATALLLQALDLPADKAVLAKLSPQAQRTRLLLHLCGLALHSQASEPSLIVVEDLHWSDHSSEEWLARLALQLAGFPILLLLTYRPDYRPAWLELSWATRLALPPLTAQASVALVRSAARQTMLSDELAQDIAERAAGNPFFLEELTRNLGGAGAAGAIPDTVQGVLAARIDQLALPDKRLLQTAAVVGTHVPRVLLAALSECPEEQLVEALQRLQRSEFLFETQVGTDQVWAFKHALTRDVAYQTLLDSVRRRLHERTAHLIETRYPERAAQQPELLARHYTDAGDYRKAVDYWRRAGRRAYEHSANPEAIEHVRRGLQVLNELAEDDDRARLELGLQMTLGPALMATEGYAAAAVKRTYTRARVISQRTGDDAALFRALIGLWNFYWVRGRLAQALDTARKLLELAHSRGDSVALLRAHAALGEVLLHSGRLAQAHDHLDQGVALYQRQSRHTHASDAPSVAGMCYSAWALWHLGLPEQARGRAYRALELARALGHPFSLVIALCLTAELHQFRSEPETTLVLAQEGVALARDQGFPFWEGTGLVLSGWAVATADRFDTGIELLRHGIDKFRATGAEVQLSSWYGLLAQAYVGAGQTEQGLQAVDTALGWVTRSGERYYEPELYRLQGRLRQMEGREAQAQRSYRRGVQAARRSGTRSRELTVALDLAGLWQAEGRRAAAFELLRPLYDSFTEGYDTPDLQRAAAVLGIEPSTVGAVADHGQGRH